MSEHVQTARPDRDDEAAPETSVVEEPSARAGGAGAGARGGLREVLGDAPIDVRSVALTVLAVLAVVAAVDVAQPVLMPIVVAVLLQFMLSPLVRFLARRGVPPMLAAALVVGAFCAGLAYGAVQLSDAAVRWGRELPGALTEVAAKLDDLKAPMEEMSRTAGRVEELASIVEEEPALRVDSGESRRELLDRLFGVTVGVPIVVALVFFMLASYDSLLRKIVQVCPRLGDKKAAVEIFRGVEHQISRYLLTVSVINLLLGLAIGAALHAVGMPNPYFWGALATLLNFVPYLGAAVGMSVVFLAALLTFDGLGRALLAPLSYLGLTALEGILVTPWVLGRRFAMTPAVIFVWVLFSGWLWGVTGALLAVPVLVVLLIVAHHSPRLRVLSVLLTR